MRAMTAKAVRNRRSKTSVSLTLAAVTAQATGTPSPSVPMWYLVPRFSVLHGSAVWTHVALPAFGLCDADVLRPSEFEHTVQHIGSDGHLGRLPAVSLRPQPISDNPLPSRDVGFDQGTIVVARSLLPAHAAALGD